MLADYQVTRIVLVPSLLRVILTTYDDLHQRLPRLKYWVSSGEALPLELARRFWQAMPDAILINLYGSSELAADSTYYEVRSDAGLSNVPIGRPIANTQVYLLDAHRQPVPLGVIGEIYIGGDGLARGYHGRPDLTAERFITNPFAPAEGGEKGRGVLYKTGDLGRYLPDGNLEYAGRIDDQVKIRGFRVELGEVEAALKRHASVQQAVVIARDDSPGDKRLVAYFVLKDGGQSTQNACDLSLSSVRNSPSLINDLRNFLKDQLPDYMLPAAFVMIDTLPLTSSGKFDRRALPKPDSAYTPLDHEYIAPRDVVERQLATIWEQVLQVKPIGVRSNFFELGGHSLLAIELFAQIEKVFGKRPSLTTLFQSPTIEQLAKVLHSEGWSNDWSTLVAIQPGGRKLPLFCVHGFGGGVIDYGELAHLLGPDQPVYGLQACGVDGLTPPHMQIEAMAGHYVDAIRTVQPHGPYSLGGYCFGGVVAFEMARQLRALGEPVAFVGIFEGYAPVGSTVRKSLWRPRLLIKFLKNMPYWLRDYLQLGREQFMARVQTKLRSATYAILRPSGRPKEVRLEDYLPNVANIPLVHQELMEVQLRAMRYYVPDAYDGRVTLFRVRGMSLFRAADPEMGWGGLARDGVDIKMIAGGHNTILQHPYVQSMAAQLKTSLEAAQRLNANHAV
jgi:thioesterase domain-containing protein/acyl carrier protein